MGISYGNFQLPDLLSVVEFCVGIANLVVLESSLPLVELHRLPLHIRAKIIEYEPTLSRALGWRNYEGGCAARVPIEKSARKKDGIEAGGR
eukprot:scaffold67731_cov33-Prasinocladus_malaysianus.AAC.2